MKKSQKIEACPCGGSSYSTCCEPLHLGLDVAKTPEQLMKSRYSAYVKKNESYLLSTWHSSTRPTDELFNGDSPKWVGLSIKNAPTPSNNSGIVEFVAIYKIGGKAHQLHEISNFVKENGRWVYLDGIFPS